MERGINQVTMVSYISYSMPMYPPYIFIYYISIYYKRGREDSCRTIFIVDRPTHKQHVLIKRQHEKQGLTADLITECRAESILKTLW